MELTSSAERALPHTLSGVTCGTALATYSRAGREAPFPSPLVFPPPLQPVYQRSRPLPQCHTLPQYGQWGIRPTQVVRLVCFLNELRRTAVGVAVATDESFRKLKTATDRLFACLWTHRTDPYLRRRLAGGCSKQDRQPESHSCTGS